jgi:hypothetical protein
MQPSSGTVAVCVNASLEQLMAAKAISLTAVAAGLATAADVSNMAVCSNFRS